MWTTVPPAKSRTPSLCRNPSGCQVQCAERRVHEEAEQTHEQQIAREADTLPANDPVISAGVMMANFS
jgi:hypothetical protein